VTFGLLTVLGAFIGGGALGFMLRGKVNEAGLRSAYRAGVEDVMVGGKRVQRRLRRREKK